MPQLWDPISLGELVLPNRLVMAPMTRSRATPEGVPTELNATYYAQRASCGLIVSEGTQPSDVGQGYIFTPGIYTEAQIAGWRGVTDAVHAAGGHLFIQLMHVGRIAHPANTPHGRQPVAPSAVTPAGQMFTLQGLQPFGEPRELSAADIDATIRDFRHAAASAVAAGADGVEIHGANGYLVQQFLSENANRRTDRYGGSIVNRTRFAVEIAAAIAAEIGADRTAIRISPGGTFNDIIEGDTTALYRSLVPQLAELHLAYLHILHRGSDELVQWIRGAWSTTLILNRAGRPREAIGADIVSGLADMEAIGGLALANPDLLQRLRENAPLNEPDPATFYGGDARGYTDYPAYG